jgi:hypothetical protein
MAEGDSAVVEDGMLEWIMTVMVARQWGLSFTEVRSAPPGIIPLLGGEKILFKSQQCLLNTESASLYHIAGRTEN